MRDAVSAGISFNIFNNHCDRVRMANIAQTINVLQAVILTEGDKMILTPTYHIFEMFKVHQDALLQPIELASSTYKFEEEEVPQLSVSASIDAAGKLNISICNTDPRNNAQVDCDIGGYVSKQVSGRILASSSMNAHNTFDQPDQVKPEAFTNVQLNEQGFSADIPPMSVVVLTLE